MVLSLVFLLLASRVPLWAGQQAQGYEPLIYFVPDVIDQFNNINQRPDGLAFGLGDSPTPKLTKHYQGIVRKTGPGTPYLFVSRNGNRAPLDECLTFDDPSTCFSDQPANLIVVRMGSRDSSGERLRSNRLVKDWEIAAVNRFGQINPWPTPPDPLDAVVTTLYFDGQSGWLNYGHAGGMQLVGDVLAVPLSHPYDPTLPENRIVFIDVSDPHVPRPLSALDPEPGPEFEAGQVALTPVRNANGVGLRYLLLVTGKDNRDVRLYRSRSTVPGDLTGPTDLKWTCIGNPDPACRPLDWDLVRSWTSDQLPAWPTEGSQSHQMFNFVRQGNLAGPLFLIATRNIESVYALGDGTDLIYLYQVQVNEFGDPGEALLTFTARKPVATNAIGGAGDTSHFTGSTGVYVSPSGELIIYASQHNAEGPFERTASGDRGPRRTVRFGEWRHIEMVRRNSPTLKPGIETSGSFAVDEGSSVTLSAQGRAAATKAWIQLFQEPGAGLTDDAEDNPVWLIVDYDDWPKDDFDDFVKLLWTFNDEARSWRWFAHPGCALSANEHTADDSDYPGRTRTLDGSLLDGSGAPAVFVDLADMPDDNGTPSMNKMISAVEFLGGCSDYYNAPIGVAWDLNGDGVFETAGEQATFPTAPVDGPALRRVPIEARHATDTSAFGRGSAFVDVVVRNVAPAIGNFALIAPGGQVVGTDVPFALVNVPYTARATFTDPGTLDHQTALLAWGDGTNDSSTQFDSFRDAFGGVVGSLAHRHAYANAGDFRLDLTVTDDDAGVALRSIGVRVLTPEQALQEIVDALDALIAVSRGAQRGRLQEARDKLASNQLGDSANGALDLLAKGNTQAAIEKIAQAIEPLRKAETADATVGALITLLEQIAISLGAI
jgi:hypothetical protein